MHVASKLIFFMVKPSTVLLVAMAIGLALLWHSRTFRLGRRTLLGAFVAFIVIGFSPLGNALILPLESRFPRPAAPPAAASGIILLGGFEDGGVSQARGALGLSEAAERLTETLLLARSIPTAKIIFTGGVANIFFDGVDAGSAVAHFFVAAGIARERILIEPRARNTYENAIFTRDLLRPGPDQQWLLVTSASHMPRAVGVFRQAGFNVVAWPVDYRTAGAGDLSKPFDSLTQGMERVEASLKEWLGLVAYHVLGRSSDLWPGVKS